MLSFVVLTIGDKPQELKLCVDSIHRNFKSKDDYEVVIVGNNIPEIDLGDVKIIEDEEKIEFLGARKNIGTNNTTGEIIVHCDDDIIFSNDWYINFLKYCDLNSDWEIMGNKVLLPDGNRYWDYATFLPTHQMMNYDFTSEDVTFYQSGAFSIGKRSLFNKLRWDDNIPFYGMFKGFDYNEDVEYSLRLKKNGIKIFFDKHNTVWHNDFTYASNNFTCNKKQTQSNIHHKCMDFILTLNSLT